jgi:bacterioferritin
MPDGTTRCDSNAALDQEERTTRSIPEVDGQPVTREALVQGLQEDIAREYQAIIQYVIFSQKLDGARYMEIANVLEEHAHEELDHAIAVAKQLDYFDAYPVHQPATVTVSEDNDLMDAEDETIKEYRKRIRQAQALGEFALAEILQEIIKQEQDHQIELASALGIVPDPNGRKEKSPLK